MSYTNPAAQFISPNKIPSNPLPPSNSAVNLNNSGTDQKGPFSAFSDFRNPVPPGVFDLEIPDYPHPDYYPESGRFQFVWFRVGHQAARYLHLGTISHGCATVRPWLPQTGDPRFQNRTTQELGLPAPQNQTFADWSDICTYLLPARKGDGRSVGILHVID